MLDANLIPKGEKVDLFWRKEGIIWSIVSQKFSGVIREIIVHISKKVKNISHKNGDPNNKSDEGTPNIR